MVNTIKDKSLLKNQCFINGAWVKSAEDNTLPIRNPFDLSHIVDIPILTTSQVNFAVDSAENAFQKWKNETAITRANYLKNWHKFIL